MPRQGFIHSILVRVFNDVQVFHAGTDRNDAGELIATGGRVLGITSRAANVKEAAAASYAALDMIDWSEGVWVCYCVMNTQSVNVEIY